MIFSQQSLRKIKFLLTFFLLLFPLFSKGQTGLEASLAEAEMGLRNMYHRIIWNMSSLNPYQFDQDKGEVTYTIEKEGYEVIAKPKVLGTFNIKNKTFLWADQNPSINKNLSDKTISFRQTLPKQYQKAKLRSSHEDNEKFLSLFGVHLDANAYDYKRQDNTIIYFCLLEIDVFKENKKLLTIEPQNHVLLQQDNSSLALVKEFLQIKCEINRLHFKEKLDIESAYQQMNEVHLKYWLNEDPYFFPALSWPCFDEPSSVLDWKVFILDGGRKFVMFTTDIGLSTTNQAYEIDPNGTGKKVIINEF